MVAGNVGGGISSVFGWVLDNELERVESWLASGLYTDSLLDGDALFANGLVDRDDG